MRIAWRIKLLAALFAAVIPLSLRAQDVVDPLDMTIAQNIATPDVPRKAEAYIREHIDHVRRNLNSSGLTAIPMRDGEVLKVTIPCSELFPINSMELKPGAFDILKKFGFIIREPERYKVLIAVHTDDTGDEQYADSISAARANAIDDAFWEIANEKETNVIPYGIGKDEPLFPNNSKKRRADNRRVEIFIIPNVGLLEMAGVKFKK